MFSAAYAGALLLDEERPGWENEIDVDQLDMGHGGHCILGQLYGGYSDGLIRLGILFTEASGLGFRAPIREVESVSAREDLYQALTEDWKKEIADRQPQAA